MKSMVLGGVVAAILGASVPVAAIELPAATAVPAGTGVTSRDLPAVPARVVADARQKTSTAGAEPAFSCDEPSAIDLHVQPGVTTLVCVAVNHLNRIVVPWTNPVVRTVSSVNVEVHGNVIYMSTAATEPASLYVLREGSEDVAVSLTLVPFRIPARELRLKISQDAMPTVQPDTGAAAKWEQSQPYVETLLAGLAEIARGRVPQGYQLRRASDQDRTPTCALPTGLSANFRNGQVLVGANLEISIGLLSNNGSAVDLVEPWCVTSQVVAVAFWPRVHLNPGERTEVYIVRRRGEPPSRVEGRPSLLGGQL
ncbi:hypothetical protein FZ983_27265 [Azospirillum sp. B21]|uniref:TraK domain-containing protein n=1 Tax=Azospirillum sp. B21 TaxID=2607496 RepID=UPI0011EF65BE|nr:type-F conjugative transfer system secretin TraK [Azospirillum sp. B21]KAA0574603.1 hypothetical protein FZ983_27265 [Azospirillum sp. B21]